MLPMLLLCAGTRTGSVGWTASGPGVALAVCSLKSSHRDSGYLLKVVSKTVT
jgi:hypothetical protein